MRTKIKVECYCFIELDRTLAAGLGSQPFGLVIITAVTNVGDI
jgi:hypothetical protein